MADNSKAKSNAAKKGGIFKFFREVKAEVKRITWPSKNETKKACSCVRLNLCCNNRRIRLYFSKPL